VPGPRIIPDGWRSLQTLNPANEDLLVVVGRSVATHQQALPSRC
jgi:hypothetical protein